MSARNTLENKRIRRAVKAAHQDVNRSTGHAQPVAKIGVCAITGRTLPVDFEFSISEPGWFAIGRWQAAVLREMEAESLRNPDMVKMEDRDAGERADSGAASD